MGNRNQDNTEQPSQRTDPHYLEIANNLRNQLKEGRFKAGQRFYSIRHLIRETRRSLPTVRSAINVLIDEAYLEPRMGSGYYVTRKVEELRNKSTLKLLTIIPSYTSPHQEPWFTGKLASGMIQAAENSRAIISFFQRSMIAPRRYDDMLYPPQSDKKSADEDIARILAEAPSGIAWVHYADCDKPQLLKLSSMGIPIVTTMRKVPGIDLPLVREDDHVYASIVLSQFLAKGHRRIAFISHSLEDDYFESKIKAFKVIGQSMGITVNDSDLFFLHREPVHVREYASRLAEFIDERKDITAIFTLASSGIHPVIQLFNLAECERLKNLSVMHNVLDGVSIPSLPTGESLARISPPLEQVGEHLVRLLMAEVQETPLPPLPRLIPVFEQGESMKPA